MYCLDTNILIDLLRGEEDVVSKINKFESSDLFITPITLFELFKGANEEEYPIIEDLISEFYVLDFDIEVSKVFGMIFKKLKEIGKMSPESDLMIASFVRLYDLVLITRDKKHFENLDIKMDVW